MKLVSEWGDSIMLDSSGAPDTNVAQAAPAAIVGAATCSATILQGGVCILSYSGASAPPPTDGLMCDGSGRAPSHAVWRSASWRDPEGDWCGLALLQRLPIGEVLAGDAVIGETWNWRCPAPTTIDVDPAVLAAFVIKTGADGATLLAFCTAHLASDAPQPHRAFAIAFLSAAAKPDGFVEIVASPEGRGAFLQGWSMALSSGTLNFSIAGGGASGNDIAVKALSTKVESFRFHHASSQAA